MDRQSNVQRRYQRFIDSILPKALPYNAKDKENNLSAYINYYLSRTQAIFKWNNLPETVPERMLELMLQINGNVCWYRYNGELYVFTGGLGGEPDVYYRPTIYTISNPALRMSVNAHINEDCIVMPSDSLYMGLIPMLSRFCTEIAETDLSLHIANINSRMIALISAQDERTRKSALKYLEDVEKGEQGVVAESALMESFKVQPYTNTGRIAGIQPLIDYRQYLVTELYKELGIDASLRNKSAELRNTEVQFNGLDLLPFVDDMFRCRDDWSKKVNEMFGTDISVELSSAWSLVHDLEHNIIDSNIQNGIANGNVDNDPTDQPEPAETDNDPTDQPEPAETDNDPTDQPEPAETDNDPTDQPEPAETDNDPTDIDPRIDITIHINADTADIATESPEEPEIVEETEGEDNE